jgi:D-tyrosyl-tRNA(Tyr) deacylase
MRSVIQRVTRGSVSVAGQSPAVIAVGLVVLVGVTHADTPAQAQVLAHKTAQLRIFEDQDGKMNRSILDVAGEVLVVPQFTLYADCRRGRRPSFTDAAQSDLAVPLIADFVSGLRKEGVSRVVTGVFGAHMMVEIHNDGPVTIILDTATL